MTKTYAMLDYDVPLTVGGPVRTKVVNWSKVFFVDSITPCKGSTKPREKLLEFLIGHQVPWGTEDKFYNTLAFSDSAVLAIEKEKRSKKG